jgi:hypothetical protein
MLTADEQSDILKLVKRLVSATLCNKTKVKSGMTTARLASANVRAAEDRLKDYLKEAG